MISKKLYFISEIIWWVGILFTPIVIMSFIGYIITNNSSIEFVFSELFLIEIGLLFISSLLAFLIEVFTLVRKKDYT
jgi:hypothetical protein